MKLHTFRLTPGKDLIFKAIPEPIWMNSKGEKDGQYIDIRVTAGA